MEGKEQMTITRDEFTTAMERLHDKLDSNKNHLNGKIETLSKEVVELQTRFAMTPIPVLPERPCPFFEKHEEEHEKIRFIWIKSVVGAVVSAIAAAIGTVLFYNHHNNGGGQ